MDAKTALKALAEATKTLTSPRSGNQLRLIPTRHDRWALRAQLEELPQFAELEEALEVESLGDLLERTGVFDQLVEGDVEPGEALGQLMQGRDAARQPVSLLHLEGVEPLGGSVELGDGFRLVTFSSEEWSGLQPKLQSEQLDPDTVCWQTFLEKRDLRLLKTPRVWRLESGSRRDPLWSGWWRPLLGLALYQHGHFSDGVRLEVEPKWQIRSEGAFHEYGEELPWTGPDSEEVWQPYRPNEYGIREAEERESLRVFVARVMRTVRRAERRDGRIALAAKRFLWASFRLASHGAWRRGDHDINEQVLFNLVRTADGLFLAEEKYQKTKKFKERVAAASGFPDLKDFLGDAYDARSRIAHGDADPPDVDLSLLHQVIRAAFIGFLGLLEAGLTPAQVNWSAVLPSTVAEFRGTAVPGSRDERRRRNRGSLR